MTTDLLFALLALPVAVSGQVRNLSMAECQRMAASRDPQTRSDSLSGEASALQERSLASAWKPSVNASLSYNRLSELDPSGIDLPFPAAMGGPRKMVISPDIPNQYGATLRVDQLLWDGGRNSRQRGSARHEREAWGAAREKNGRELASKVAVAYWNLGAAQAALEAAKRAGARADSQATLAVASFRQGTALEQDTLQARLRTRQIELSIEQAQASREFALQTLQVAMGEPLALDCRASDPLEPLAPIPAQPDAERPELRQAREQILSAQEGLEASRAGYWPVVQASAQYDIQNPNQRMVPAHDAFDATWRVGANATWNLYRGGADDLAVRRSALAIQQARLRETALGDAIGQEVLRRGTELRLARRRRGIAERNLPLARRDLELAVLRSQAGTALRLEAIDRASALSQAESDLAQAIASENIAILNLSIARGEAPRWK
ncbi:MAG TPA: TolC family protein [Fibrobacteria bacterium]|nr:TolC family protein [Fibrobacteria bacterium]HOX50502.1 TolC family protein [Fibrobacteria bacterium]